MIEPRSGFGGRDVVAALDRIVGSTGTPLSITVDHGTEITSKALEDWAYQRAYPNSALRNAALPGWMHRYNHQRPHASLGRKPPISRVAAPVCQQSP